MFAIHPVGPRPNATVRMRCLGCQHPWVLLVTAQDLHGKRACPNCGKIQVVGPACVSPEVAAGLRSRDRQWEKDKRSAFKATKRAKKQKRPRPKSTLGPPHPDYRRDDRFYSSSAWRTLRYQALANNGAQCQCCGAKASDGLQIHVDHIVPRYKAPALSLDLSNLQVLCEDCNIGKGATDTTDWREHWKSI